MTDTLRAQIESGGFSDKEPLPPERELAQRLGVSRDTLRKAIRLLTEQGLIYSDQGRGTFVTSASVREMSRAVGSFTLDTLKHGGTPGQKILKLERVTAGLAIARVMQVPIETELLYLRRLRFVNGDPVGIQSSWLALPKGLGFTAAELMRKGSLYRLLVEDRELRPSMAIESLGATTGSPEELELLGLAEGSPLLLCERITLSDRRVPIEFCDMRYAPSYRYNNKVTDWGS